MDIPDWSRAYLKPERVQMIADAVKKAEAKTSGEIVPMIVRRSSTVGHVPVVLLSLLVALFFALDGPGLQADLLGDHWALYLGDIALLMVVCALLSKLHWVQRALTSRSDQDDQVEMRAEIEFYESNIKNTTGSTGVLLFASLMERRAVVLADKAISEKVSKEAWQEVCDLLVGGIKKGNMGLAFSDAIAKCGDILAPEFPIQHDDVNELTDHLIIKE